MNKKLRSKFDIMTIIGFIAILLQIPFLLSSSSLRFAGVLNNDFSGGFSINYIISILYFIGFLFFSLPKKNELSKKQKMLHFLLATTIFSISAFTLNNSMNIFSAFPTWMIVYLVVFYIAFVLIGFIDILPKYFRIINSFILGAGAIIMLHMTIYLSAVMVIGIIGAIFLGISLHSFVPALVIGTLVATFRKINKTKIQKWSFAVGSAVPIAIFIIFLFKMSAVNSDVHKVHSTIITSPNNTLPKWVLLSQELASDDMTQSIIAGDLIYDSFKDLGFNSGNRGFDEFKVHNPLMIAGQSLMGRTNIDRKTRIQILKSKFNARHHTQRRLWSGKDLGTIDVLNNIQIFPEYRIAYAEKILTVKNFNNFGSQEAAYTFYLPEGSIATSLSLWIDGKEEKSRLTTKSKADSAYRTVVGVERRDPALMHWQEGNTLTVTVFPCTSKENRIFKIGITTPLRLADDKLIFDNVYFDGPPPTGALETTVVTIESDKEDIDLDLPSGFSEIAPNKFQYDGSFRPTWEIELDAVPLSKKSFFFNNNSYSLKELKKEKKSISPKRIYLDINSSWNYSEFDKITNGFGSKNIYVYTDELVKIGNGNMRKLFNILSNRNFSLFPFHLVKDPENSIIISKSDELSPNISDLEGSIFADSLLSKLKDKKKFNLAFIGDKITPYLKTLKELNAFDYFHGNAQEIIELVNSKKFVVSNPRNNEIELDISNVTIRKDSSSSTSNAPDHLMRLYAYSDLMRTLGIDILTKTQEQYDKLIPIANEAYIVSPISSLVVLESVKDYDRFGIGENKNSLKNASVHSKGAVPEPEEWALIILFALILVGLVIRKRIG
jgi:XrtN system VIT domain protein